MFVAQITPRSSLFMEHQKKKSNEREQKEMPIERIELATSTLLVSRSTIELNRHLMYKKRVHQDINHVRDEVLDTAGHGRPSRSFREVNEINNHAASLQLP